MLVLSGDTPYVTISRQLDAQQPGPLSLTISYHPGIVMPMFYRGASVRIPQSLANFY